MEDELTIAGIVEALAVPLGVIISLIIFGILALVDKAKDRRRKKRRGW